jgi:hypothetical protein
MRRLSFPRRRPSVPMVISLVALFVALGGTSWAAFSLPRNSVGTRQLRNGAVTGRKIATDSVGSRKIRHGAVGAGQINSSQVQERVAAACIGNNAIQGINAHGGTACTPTAPREFGTSTPGLPLGSGSTTVATKTIPSTGPYLIMGMPHVLITGATTPVTVDCSLLVPGGGLGDVNKSLTFAGTGSNAGTIPLVSTAPTGGTVTVTCDHSGTASSITVDTTLNAIQTASNS